MTRGKGRLKRSLSKLLSTYRKRSSEVGALDNLFMSIGVWGGAEREFDTPAQLCQVVPSGEVVSGKAGSSGREGIAKCPLSNWPVNLDYFCLSKSCPFLAASELLPRKGKGPGRCALTSSPVCLISLRYCRRNSSISCSCIWSKFPSMYLNSASSSSGYLSHSALRLVL